MEKKSKLTSEEMKIFKERVESVDKRVDHSNAMRCMSNEARRELLNFIGYEVRNMEEIRQKFEIEEDQLRYHLSMLEHSLYVMDSQEVLTILNSIYSIFKYTVYFQNCQVILLLLPTPKS